MISMALYTNEMYNLLLKYYVMWFDKVACNTV